MTTLKEKLLNAGINGSDIDSHCSDLYVKKSETSKKVISEYEFKNLVNTFISNIDKQEWYEVPFAYVEYFRGRAT